MWMYAVSRSRVEGLGRAGCSHGPPLASNHHHHHLPSMPSPEPPLALHDIPGEP